MPPEVSSTSSRALTNAGLDHSAFNFGQPLDILCRKQLGIGLALHFVGGISAAWIVNPGVTQIAVLVEKNNWRGLQRDTESLLTFHHRLFHPPSSCNVLIIADDRVHSRFGQQVRADC